MECLLREAISEDGNAFNLERKIISRFGTEATEVNVLKALTWGLRRLPARISKRANFPASLSNLANLTTLNLNDNKLRQFPEVVFDFVNLTHLFVNHNQLSTLPANLNCLEKLQELELRNNKLKRVFKYIFDLNNLEKLSVSGNPLTFQEIKSLMMLMDLKSQRISIDIAG